MNSNAESNHTARSLAAIAADMKQELKEAGWPIRI